MTIMPSTFVVTYRSQSASAPKAAVTTAVTNAAGPAVETHALCPAVKATGMLVALAPTAARGAPLATVTCLPSAAERLTVREAIRFPRLGGVFAEFALGDRNTSPDDHHRVRLRQRAGLRAQTRVFARGRRTHAPIVDRRFNLHQGEFGHPFIPSNVRAGASILARAGVPALLHSTDCAVLAAAPSVLPIV